MALVLVWVFATAACLGLVGCKNEQTDQDVFDREIKLAQVQKLYQKRGEGDLLLIDAEMPNRFAEKHIAGAINIPFANMSGKENDIDPRIERYSNIIVYGRNRAPGPVFAATKLMLHSGYDVRAFLGGLEEWERAGMPIETGPGKTTLGEKRSGLKK